jgi:hypothetical protein
MNSIPIIVGVSGHRDLVGADLPAIRQHVSDALVSLERLTPDTPRILLSALAEGADQLVAEVALNRGWQVVAAPPMPLGDFIRDFETEPARQRFHDLLGQCVSVQELPWATQLDPDISNSRDQQYRDQGTYLARQAQVVIALWDGQENATGAVGTSWAVRICREGPPPVEGAVLAAPETTGLVHIPVRRAKAPDVPPIGVAESASDNAYRKVLREIDAFNRSLQQCREFQPIDVADSMDWLLPQEERAGLDDGVAYLLHRHAEADALARKYQRQRKQVIIAASTMTVIAAVSQATYGVFSSQPWIIAYGVTIALAYMLYYLLFRLPHFRIEERFLEYRAFAEAARVQLFWRLAGLDTLVAEHYLQLVKSDVGWVREAVRAMGFQAKLMVPVAEAKIGLVRDRWLLDQINYFFGKGTTEKPGNIAKRKFWQARAETAAMVSFGLGALLVFLAGLGYLLPSIEDWKDATSAYSASLFLIAGVIKGFAATMGYEEEAASFEKAGAVFRNALAYIDAHAGDEERCRVCIFELGKYALAENADWLLQHRRNAFNIQS